MLQYAVTGKYQTLVRSRSPEVQWSSGSIEADLTKEILQD